MPDKVDEGKTVVDEAVEKDGKHPETVSWTQYVGLKERFNKVESDLTKKVSSLEEQLKSSPNAEEFTKTKAELDKIKAEHQKVSDELKSFKDKSVSEKRESLKKQGVPEEDLKDLSEAELDKLNRVVGKIKPVPRADMGGSGGGSGDLRGSPLELAQRAYQSSNKK